MGAASLLVVGLLVLAFASDQFVLGAARIAVTLRVSTVIVGAVIIGFGTGMPELLVSVLAASQGEQAVAVGNVVGSNLANIGLVLGVAAILARPEVVPEVLRREAPLALGSVGVLAFTVQRGLSRNEGIVLLVLQVLVTVGLVAAARAGRGGAAEDDLTDEVEALVDVGDEESLADVRRASSLPDVARTVGGLLGTLLGAHLLVTGAVDIATDLGLSGGFVGVAIVAVGTSLPELVTAVQAVRRAEVGLVVGNVLGSNIFNSLGVAGAAAVVGPGVITDAKLTVVAVVAMLGVAVLGTAFLVSAGRVRRWEGAVLLSCYVATMPFIA